MYKKLQLSTMFLLLLWFSPGITSAKNITHVEKTDFLLYDKSVAGFKSVNALSFEDITTGQKRLDVQTMHLVTHGKPGMLLIDGSWMNAQELVVYFSNNRIHIQHNLILYGCEFAKGAEGINALHYLESRLGISVAASDNITGSSKNGGDWLMEYNPSSLLSYTFPELKTTLQFSCSGPNLLINPSFELPVVPNGGGANNIVASIPNWTNLSTSPGSVNVLSVTGTGIGGPGTAAQGNQYIDLQGTTGIMDQKFTLASAAALHFSGKFANRAYTAPNYVGGAIGVQVFDTAMNLVAAVAGNLSAADTYDWKTLSGLTAVLPAGTYTFRFYSFTDFAHYDDMSVCVANNAATSCSNKTVMTNPGTWTASASGNLAGWPASKIIDGNLNDIAGNSWVSPTTAPAGSYVTLDFGTAMDLVGFVFYPRFTVAQDIARYTAQYSNDGVSYTNIQTAYLQRQQSVYASPTGNPIEANFATEVNARYLRIIVNSVYDAGSYASILELLPIVCNNTATYPTISCINANLLNSGTNATGTGKKAVYTFDNNWTTAYVKGKTGVSIASVTSRSFLPAIITGNKAPGLWINSPYGSAEWLAYSLSGYDVNSYGSGDGLSQNTYFYKCRFNIADTYALAAFKLRIDFYVDNVVDNIYINGVSYGASLGLPSGSFSAGSQVSATLNAGWQLGANEILIQTSSQPGLNGFLIQNISGCLGVDFGDAPTSYVVTKANNGPGHIIETNPAGGVTLRLGASVDAEPDGVASALSDNDNIIGSSDEDGLTAAFPGIPAGANPVISNYTVTLAVSNTTGSIANLCGWIDWNVNGVFDAGEGVCTTVANGATTATLVWPSANFVGTAGITPTYARFRITSGTLTASTPVGPASNGEVEDYRINFPPICVTKVVQPTGLNWTATASATSSGSAAQIVDGTFATTGWVSTVPAANSFITINFNTALDLTGFVCYPRSGTAAQDINAYTVSYSTDGISFTNIQSGNLLQQSYSSVTGTGSPSIVTFTGTYNAQYLRLTVNSTYQNNAAGIAELLPIVCQPPSYTLISCENANLLNTGTDQTGTSTSALNIFDRSWEVATISNNLAATYATVSNAIFLPAIVIGNAIPAAWSNSPFSNAEWLGYTPTGLDNYSVINGANDYFYRYKFEITDPYQLAGFKLKLNFMADNQVQNVYINGVGQAPQTGLPQSNNNYVYGGFQLANQSQTILRNNWQLGPNEIMVHIKSYPTYAGFLGQNITECDGVDFGDAPSSYNVPKAVNGPGHMIETNTSDSVTLKMGVTIDAETDGIASVNSDNDGNDEDGVTTPIIAVNYCTVASYTATVNVTNITGDSANLIGWIDFDGSGTFDAAEGVSASVADGVSGTNVSLTWSGNLITVPDTTTRLFSRFRISTDALNTGSPNGVASDGEVEDYVIPLTWIDYDFGNLPPLTWPVAFASKPTNDATWLGLDPANTECATNTLDSADGFSILGVAGGSGTNGDPWMLNGSGSNYTFQVTVNGSGVPKPVYWAVWYDVDGNGNFTDSSDIFQSGNDVHNGPVSSTFSVTIPYGHGETSGAIRVASAAADPAFTKSMNGAGNFINGEVEDYYLIYTTPLPMDLVSFTAEKSGEDGMLQWVSANGQNTTTFIIEHSIDGKHFNEIGSVEASDNTSTASKYHFTHKKPGEGGHYYRLKMLDTDNAHRYSETRVLNFGNAHHILLYPNPAKHQVVISGLNYNEEIRIASSDGRVVSNKKANNNTEIIDISNLSQGFYLVQVIHDGAVVTVIKIVKEI